MTIWGAKRGFAEAALAQPASATIRSCNVGCGCWPVGWLACCCVSYLLAVGCFLRAAIRTCYEVTTSSTNFLSHGILDFVGEINWPAVVAAASLI